MNIKILVATHKAYWMPEDDVYLPIHVGREGKEDIGFLGDNTGNNISIKNPNYCELTGLYWAWKNLQCDYIGLCHYRRYFATPLFSDDLKTKQHSILTKEQYAELLNKYDLLVPWRLCLKNKTVRDQYAENHNIEDLLKVRKIISDSSSEYLDAFDTVMATNKLYICNMFVAKKELFDDYAKWLFTILFKLEEEIDLSKYDNYQSRVFGFISERLFNVWLYKNKFKIKELPCVFLEENISFFTRIKRYCKYKIYE